MRKKIQIIIIDVEDYMKDFLKGLAKGLKEVEPK